MSTHRSLVSLASLAALAALALISARPVPARPIPARPHFDDLRQQYGGLVGALVVLEPGERWDPTRDRMILLSDGVPQRVYFNGSLTPAPQALEVGRTYRLRIADIAAFRFVLRVQLVRDSALQSWRPIAKDGFTLPASQATVRPSVVNLPSGETADFEFTPNKPGELALEAWSFPGVTPTIMHGRLLFNVSAAGDSVPSRRSSSRVDETARQAGWSARHVAIQTAAGAATQ